MKKIYNLDPHFDNSSQGSSRITFYSRKLTKKYFNMFGKGARNKTIPFNFIFYPKSTLEFLLKGYTDGDGSILKKGYSMFTTSEKLKNMFILILNKMNICPNISIVKIKNNIYKGRLIKSNGDGYKIDIIKNKSRYKYWKDKDYYYVPIKQYSTYYYDGNVYNFEVEDDNSYVANGITVHNCLSILDFEISDGQLHTTGYFRSWDAYAGLPSNLAGIQLLVEYMVNKMSEYGLNLKTGKFVFHSKNCHIYKRQYGMVEQLLKPKYNRNNIEGGEII